MLLGLLKRALCLMHNSLDTSLFIMAWTSCKSSMSSSLKGSFLTLINNALIEFYLWTLGHEALWCVQDGDIIVDGNALQ